jgi:uncharacterized SAM-binding protein YcdF (DUF218 family)
MIDSVFALKKIAGEFMGPLSVGLFIAAAGLYALYRGRLGAAKILLPLSLGWIALLSYGPAGYLLLKPLEQQYPALIETPQNIKYVLVLGSGHKSDNRLPINTQIDPTALIRLSEGIRHFHNLQNANLVVSGSRGVYDANTQASMQKGAAVSLGLKSDDIVMFEKPKDTEEEAAEMKALVGSEPFILVTSASHMPRAIRIFTHLGLSPIAAPTDYNARGRIEWRNMPNGEGLRRSDQAFHEYYGHVWQWIKR